jgi:hypothetical protein|tara:strand:+ start:15390 stop:16307 length:918 start_codon:yes stop_codon:yes gene_type:complete
MEYFKDKRVSNSSLSYINPEQGGSARKFKDYLDGNLAHLETPSLYHGSMIHKFLLEPETFAVADVERPSDTIVKIMDKVYNITKGELDTDINKYHEYIFGSARELNYGQTWKPDTLIKKVIDQGKDYYDFLLRADGKVCIDQKMAGMLSAIKDSITTHKAASDLLFTGEGENESEYFWGPDQAYKSKIDRYQKTGTKVNLIDLKTTSKSVEMFRDSFEYYHYDRQMAFYVDALEDNYMLVDKVYIIAVETTGYYQVRVFEIGKNLIEEGRKKYKDLLERVKWHQERQLWTESRESFESKGVTLLN